MEIPYIVTPRKDTGLFNSKIAIWLFLASEVMLFGGFFSAYVYLRLGAEHDYPWPERALPILPGLINTFVLIFSSVTVVFAWASLKLRQWARFQIFMAITVACAGVFMVLKSIEYNVKFHHQALRMMDYSIAEGHLGKVHKEGSHTELEHDAHGKEIEADVINFETNTVTYDVVRFHGEWVKEMLAEAEEHKSKIVLASDVKLQAKGEDKVTLFPAGSELSIKLLDQIADLHKAARGHNSNVRIKNLRQQWEVATEANKGRPKIEWQKDVAVDEKAIAGDLIPEQPAVAFKVEPPMAFRFHPRDIKEGPASGTLRDGTALAGKLLESDMDFHAVDALDFRHTVMKAKEKGIDPEVAIKNSWIIKNNPEIAEIWEKKEKAVHQMEEVFQKEYEEKLAKGHKSAVLREPTIKDRYRIDWAEMAYYGKTSLADVQIDPKAFACPSVEKTMKEQFFGPDYEHRKFPELVVPRQQVQFASKFTPSWNTFYAIYFTMTGLHGLHVIGGAIVLGYYLFFGRKMYLTNPEWLANRVEVGGLFWHFVDLVWIFLFPILYLM